MSFRNTSDYFQLVVNTVLLFCSLELQKIEEAHKHIRRTEVLSESLNPSNTEPVSKLGIVNSILAVGYCAIGNYRAAQDLIEKGLVIVKDTYGPNSMCYVIALLNFCVISFANDHDQSEAGKDLEKVNKIMGQIDSNKQLNSFYSKIDKIQQFINHDLERCQDLRICHETNFLALCCYNLLDHPWGWIDFAPVRHVIVLGSDSQVWEHFEKSRKTWPFRYQWISSTWLGEFHKLKNHHLRLKKCYLDFHIREHARHFLNDATVNKLEKFLRMDDFDLTNDFFYYDLIAGLTELFIAVKRYLKKQSEHEYESLDVPQEQDPLTFASLKDICTKIANKNPTLKIVLKYLLEDNLSTAGFLESQNFGNFSLNQSIQKLTAPLNFTTNA